MCTQRNVCIEVTKERQKEKRNGRAAGIKQLPFYLLFMGYSRYLNVCHIGKDLLNSIYYNVMFGLNGKSIVRQAHHHWDHTKQFPNWHMEGLCDWFWLLVDFNTVHCELIDSQTSSCGLSTNCQMSPCLLFPSLSFFFLSPSFFGPSSQPNAGRVDMLN